MTPTPSVVAHIDVPITAWCAGAVVHRLVQVGDIAVSENCTAEQIADLTAALSQPPTVSIGAVDA